MRALVVFLLVAVAFGLVVLLYPNSSPVEGAGPAGMATPPVAAVDPLAPDGTAGDAPVRGFLERDLGAHGAVAGGAVPGDGAGQDRAGAPGEPRDLPDWLAGVEALPDPVDEGQMRVAEALLHGSVDQVEERLAVAGLDPGAERMARSFALAIAGERRRALDLAGRFAEGDLEALERSLLQEALGGEESTTGVGRRDWTDGGLLRGMGMALASRRAEERLAARRYGEAARLLSDLLISELEAPWEVHRAALGRWSELLAEAQGQHRWNPRGDWPGLELTVETGDSAISVRKRYLARRPGSVMCAGLILRANAVRGYLQPGQLLRVPTDEVSVLVDLSARWTLYLHGSEVVAAWPVGIGRPGQETRTGRFRAGNKLENPPWMKVGQAPVPYGDPANPLGTRWIGWFEGDLSTSFGFHGTWEPESIGEASSDGCIRLLNEDVEELFEILPEGAPILVRP